MKKFYFLLMFFGFQLAMQAQSYNYLVFQTASGTQYSCSLSDGIKITFSDGKAIAEFGDSYESFNLSELSTMYFSDEPTHVAAVSLLEQEPDAIYTLDGRLIGRNLSSMPTRPGIYLVRKNGVTKKVFIK